MTSPPSLRALLESPPPQTYCAIRVRVSQYPDASRCVRLSWGAGMPPRASQNEHPGRSAVVRTLDLHSRGIASRTSPRAAKLCRFCSSPASGNTVIPGPAFGHVHESCFAAWDREQEALELEFARAASFPLPDSLELELDRDFAETPPRAA